MSRSCEVPRVAFSLLGEIALLSDGVDDQRILLALLLEEVGGSDLRQAQDLGKIGVLVAGELGDVPLRDLFEGLLLLHLPQLLGSSSFDSHILRHTSFLLLASAHSLYFLLIAPVGPFPVHEVRELPYLELLELPGAFVGQALLPLQEVLQFSE